LRKSFSVLLFVLFVLLQYRLWWGVGSIHDKNLVLKQIKDYKLQIAEFKLRNDEVKKDINNLKTNPDALEEIAREQLGLIKKNEFFFRVLH